MEDKHKVLSAHVVYVMLKSLTKPETFGRNYPKKSFNRLCELRGEYFPPGNTAEIVRDFEEKTFKSSNSSRMLVLK